MEARGKFMGVKMPVKSNAASNKSIDALFGLESLMLSTVLLMAVMILSCSKKSDDSGTAETPQQLNQFSADTEFKNFKSISTVQLNDRSSYQNYLEDRYGSSCIVRRNSNGEISSFREMGSFSDSLMVNDKVFYRFQIQNQIENMKTENSIAVADVSEKFATVQTTVLSMLIPAAGGEVLVHPIPDQEACHWPIGSLSPVCKGPDHPMEFYSFYMTPQGFEYLKSANLRQKQVCSFVGQLSSSAVIEKGSFLFQDGHSIQSYKVTTTEIGSIMCNGTMKGTGEQKTISIYSNEIKAMPGLEGYARGGNFSCGGALVAESRLMRVQAGLIETTRFEQIQPALK